MKPDPSAPISSDRRRAMCLTLAACAGGLVLPLIGRAAAPTRIRFTLDWRFDGPGAIVLLAAARGYFAAENLDVVIDAGNGSAGAIQRLASGTHDIGFADVNSLVEYLAGGTALPRIQAVYMLADKTPAAALALKSSGIRTPADLIGRKLGAPVFDAGRKLFPIFAKANGLDAKRALWTNADPALRETLLIRGDLEAITGFSYTSMLNLEARGVKQNDVVVFKYADYGVNLYGNAVVVSPKFIQEHPEAVSAFLRALNRSIKETIADPKAAVAHVIAREPILDTAVEERRLRLFLADTVATPSARARGLGGVDEARLRAGVTQVCDAFGLLQVPDAAQLFTSRFLPSREERRL